MLCQSCGKEIDENLSYCPYCGQLSGAQIIDGATQLLTPELAAKLEKQSSNVNNQQPGINSYNQNSSMAGMSYQGGYDSTLGDYQQDFGGQILNRQNYDYQGQYNMKFEANNYQNMFAENGLNQYDSTGQFQDSQTFEGAFQQNYQQSTDGYQQSPALVAEGRDVISMLGYVGYSILYALPVIGLICMIYFAITSPVGSNKRNFALAHIVLLLLGIILGIVLSGMYANLLAITPNSI